MSIYLMLIFAIISIIIVRAILLRFPGEYFTVQDIVTTNEKELNLIGILIRFSVLLIFSVIICFITDGNTYYVIEYGFLFCLLLIWPFILENIILYNKKQEGTPGYNSRSIPFIKKYLFVYILFSALCIVFCSLSLPVYGLIKIRPMIFYKMFLVNYLKLDLFAQSVISNSISTIILCIIGVILKKLYRKVIKPVL